MEKENFQDINSLKNSIGQTKSKENTGKSILG